MDHEEKIDNIILQEMSSASMRMMSGIHAARYYANRVSYWINGLPHIPYWETMAEEEIEAALASVRAVERRLVETLATYRAKPKGD